MARVLIVGRGVFGSLATDELRSRGHEATSVSRSTGVDARDEASVTAAARGFDAIAHAAGPFRGQPPAVARAAVALGVPYVDISDDRAFSASVRALDAATPILTGMSTTPALAEALAAIARGNDRGSSATCAMYVGGGNEQGPATAEFAARSRAPGAPIVVDFGPIGRRRAYPARAYFDGGYFVAVGGLAGLAWRARPLLRALAPLASHVPRLSRDTAGALVAFAADRREGVYALERGQRMAVLPAVWALEEALAGRAPRRAALPAEWVEPERLVGFTAANGFERVSA